MKYTCCTALFYVGIDSSVVFYCMYRISLSCIAVCVSNHTLPPQKLISTSNPDFAIQKEENVWKKMSSSLKATAEWVCETPQCECFTLWLTDAHTQTHTETWCERCFKVRLPLLNPAWLDTTHLASRSVHLSCRTLTLSSSDEDACVSRQSLNLSLLLYVTAWMNESHHYKWSCCLFKQWNLKQLVIGQAAICANLQPYLFL